jgi:hypothetical protein
VEDHHPAADALTPNPDGTLMKDEFHFAAPFGILGTIAEWLFLKRYMENFLSERGLALKRLAESPDWQRYLPIVAGDSQQ